MLFSVTLIGHEWSLKIIMNKILVVDDKKEVVDFILEILELTNYQVYTASDGDEAWKIFQDKSDIAHAGGVPRQPLAAGV